MSGAKASLSSVCILLGLGIFILGNQHAAAEDATNDVDLIAMPGARHPGRSESFEPSVQAGRSTIGIAVLGLLGEPSEELPFAPQYGNQPLLSVPDDIYWDPRFNPRGTSGSVYALVWGGGVLYAGGSFTSAGDTTVNCVGKWDGASWSALGSGTDPWGYVYALAWDGSNLYAGGAFTSAGGTPANYVARWDGTSWSALGSGTDGSVKALAWDGTGLYAGGGFTTAGGVPARRVAMWDGAAWSALGSGLANPVRALVSDDSNLYAGSRSANPSTIAKWDGSSWSVLGVMNSSVESLAWD